MLTFCSDSYEKVKENETIEALQERAKMIVDMELLCESRARHHKPLYMTQSKIAKIRRFIRCSAQSTGLGESPKIDSSSADELSAAGNFQRPRASSQASKAISGR
eukprot:COSAG01_NODE_2402_length_7759_cov_9.960313_9_plen_105_part_00